MTGCVEKSHCGAGKSRLSHLRFPVSYTFTISDLVFGLDLAAAWSNASHSPCGSFWLESLCMDMTKI